MGAHQDPVQRAVVFILAMVSALLDSTFDAFICVTVHKEILLFIGFGNSMAMQGKSILEMVSKVAFFSGMCYFNNE